MKTVLVTLALVFAAQPALAQQRPSTTQQNCAASQQLIQQRGAMVLGTGGFTYDRFVRDPSFCQHGEFLEPAFVPSRDRDACFIGYRCKVDAPWD